MKYTYRIERDDLSSNPRDEFDEISTFYGVSGRYLVGGKKDIEFSYRDELEDEIKELRKQGAVIVEFDSNAGTCYAVVERHQLKKEYLDYGYSMRKALYHARKCAEGEISTFLAWCDGDVYGYIVDSDDEKHIESCWGYYGDDGRKEAESEAKSFIVWKLKDDEKQEHLINVSFAI